MGNPTTWLAAQTIATAIACAAAVVYVVLTYRLVSQTAAHRESELMLRLIDGYDRLRDDLDFIQSYYIECACSGPTDAVARFGEEMANVDFVGDQNARAVDARRFRVSRFFVRTRKLVQAGFLSEGVVLAALDREAIELFLKDIDPLDAAAAGESYKRDDRDFFERLLTKYPRKAARDGQLI